MGVEGLREHDIYVFTVVKTLVIKYYCLSYEVVTSDVDSEVSNSY